MIDFKQLKKLSKLKSDSTNTAIKLAVLGDTSTQLLVTAIKGYAYHEDINLDVYEAEYNQIFPEIINTSSEFYSYNPDYTFIYMSSEKLFDEFCKTDFSEKNHFAEKIVSKIVNQWSLIQNNLKTRIIQTNFIEINDMIYGTFGSKVPHSFIYQLRKLNYLLMEEVSKNKNVYLCDISTIQNTFGRKNIFDEKYYYSARLAINIEFLPYISKQIIDTIKSLSGKIKKCIVLDLDNTLWGGVIGDDGINNIQIGELGVGRAFSDFQLWLKELKNRGILLAVCSKNDEVNAKEPFEKHPEMVLRLEDFAIFVANWQDKASNIKYIQETLNIGMDSFVFVDDNPFERNLVKQMLPEVTVPDLPEDPSLYLTYLKEQNLFEVSTYSEEDINRTSQYRAEANRVQLQQNFSSIEDYLISLEMEGIAKPFDEFNIPRISQLTQRSNQFNLRTIRYSEEDIANIAKSDKYITLYFCIKDKFGDHGLISVVILEKRSDYLFIDTWLMSCRVLKRTVEEFIINKIISTAKAHQFFKVKGEYIPTKKNNMVKNIYEEMGFTKLDDNLFEADVNNFKYNKTFIKEL